MISNTETTATTQRQGIANLPRAIVTVNGTQVTVKIIEHNMAQFGYADTFRISVPLGGQPSKINRAFFAANPKVTVSAYVGYPPNPSSFTINDLDLLITGLTDTQDDDLCRNCIELEGRDLTAKFIDEQISQTFPNQTSSQIVTMFAKQWGLTPQVTATTTPVGNFSYNQQTLLGSQMSQWDLMVSLAQNEGFVVFVQGNTLIFEPRPTTAKTPYLLTYQPATTGNSIPSVNCERLNVITNASVAGDVKVTVKVPYDPKTGTAFSATLKTTQKSGNSPGIKKYVYRKPGLTPQQAQQAATQLLAQHTSQGRGISFSLAGDNLLKKDSVIQLKGSDYDGFYFPDEINRTIRLSGNKGYDMTVYARNTAQDIEMPSAGGAAA